MRVLVAEDDPAMAEALRRALMLTGYSVDLAVNGLDALERMTVDPPDVVVLDVLMPRCDGLEVCRRLRGAGDDTPVLMLTVRDRVEDIVAGLDAGADDYLTKPFVVPTICPAASAQTHTAPGSRSRPSSSG